MLVKADWSGLKKLLVLKATDKATVYTIEDQTFTIMQKLALTDPIPAGTYKVYVDIESTDTDSSKSLFRFVDNVDGTVAKDVSEMFELPREHNVFTAVLSNTANALFLYAGISYPQSVGDTATFSNIKFVKM